MSDVDLDALRDRYLNVEFDVQTYELDAERCIAYARACGETAPRYTDATHPDFQAPPTILSSLRARQLPDDFPRPEGMGMDGGKAVELVRPVRPGTTITGRNHVHDIYTKTGRSGRMIFIVTRVDFENEAGEALAAADTSLVIREKPAQ